MCCFKKKGDGHCRIRHLLLVIMLLSAWCLPVPAEAEIYRWQDENGHWHYSDSPTSDDKTRKALTPVGEISSTPQPDDPSTLPSRSAPVPSDKVPSAPETNVNGGLLWKISKNGQRPSYLLGTIHSADPRVTSLKSVVTHALDSSDRFVMEMVLDTSAIMQFGASMMLGQGEDLERILGPELFGRVVSAMAGAGMPEMVVHQLKPWVVMAILSMPPASGEMILDMVLHQRATGQGKPASGLETSKEQLEIFDGLSRPDQIELLKMTLDHLPSQPGMFEQLIEAYAADDLNQITRIAHQYNARSPSEAATRFMRRLNDERNIRMVQRMIPYLQQANSFIAVGALHLAGDNGILARLRGQGYDTTPLRSPP